MFRITSLTALEILDSRGRPTVQATCGLAPNIKATASVPSGASTGTAEALELRDGDPHRYRGLGCRRAVSHIEGILAQTLVGCEFASQADLDQKLLEIDGSANKAHLGANALLAVSIAFARAGARQRGRELHEHFAAVADLHGQQLPRPTINLFSGGRHAGGQAPLQDILVVPASARTMDEALAMTFAVYYAAADLCQKKYAMRLLRADEGGLAPPFTQAEEMIEDAIRAIEMAGCKPGVDVALAIDVASTQFHEKGRYQLQASLTSAEMIETLHAWVERYPIVSLEDGLAEDDWDHWPELTRRVRGRTLVVGDDFLCTNPARLRRAIDTQAATALLLKVNQIGTLTEANEARALARGAGWQVTISARSGETEDDWLADLAVGWSGDQIKIGSITQSDRLAKYNRLLAIEAATRWKLNPWPGIIR
jgi:enolase